MGRPQPAKSARGLWDWLPEGSDARAEPFHLGDESLHQPAAKGIRGFPR